MTKKNLDWLILLLLSIVVANFAFIIHDGAGNPVIETSSLDNGLVGYWRFDEGAGTTAGDSSGNGNHGTIYGASWADGKMGKALSFNGTTDYVEVLHNSSLNFDALTWAAWVKVDTTVDTTATHGIVGKTYGMDLLGEWYTAVDDVTFKPKFRWVGDSGQIILYGNAVLSSGTWYHLAGTYDGLTMKIYVNGMEDVSTSQSGPFQNTMPLWIGRGGRAHYLDGMIDEVRIYNRVLSASEIQELASVTATLIWVSPENFIENSGGSRTLIATLKDENNNPIANKTITWSTTSGDISPSSGTTDSSGQVSVTYMAPTITNPTAVTITASFAGDNQYGRSTGTSSGVLTVLVSENIPASTGGTIVVNVIELNVTVNMLVVQPNALPNDTTVTIVRTLPETFPGYMMVSEIFDIGPSGTSFAGPSTLTLPYNENEIPEGVGEENLAIYRRTGDNWERLGGTVDVSANTVSVQIDHLSEYAVMAQLPTQLSVVVTPVWAIVVAAIVLVAVLSGIIWRYAITSKKERLVKGQKRKQAARVKRKRRTR